MSETSTPLRLRVLLNVFDESSRFSVGFRGVRVQSRERDRSDMTVRPFVKMLSQVTVKLGTSPKGTGRDEVTRVREIGGILP